MRLAGGFLDPREGRRGRPRERARATRRRTVRPWVYSRRPSSRSSPRGRGGTVARWWTRRRPSRRLGRTPRERRVEPRRGGAGVASLEDDERGDAAVVAADEAVAAGGPGEGGDGGAAVALGDASLVPARDAACFLLAADAGLAELDNLELAILERDDEAGVLGVEAEGDDGLVRGAARVGLDEETVEEAKGGVVGVALGGAVGDGVAKRAGGGATSEDVHAADVRPEQHVLGRGVQAKEAHARARHGAYRVGVDETLERVEGKGRGRASVAGGGLNLRTFPTRGALAVRRGWKNATRARTFQEQPPSSATVTGWSPADSSGASAILSPPVLAPPRSPELGRARRNASERW